MPRPDPPVETRFQPGWKGGPGRPKRGSITEAARFYLEQAHPKKPELTRAEVIGLKWVRRAEQGKDLVELLNRTDGKIPDPVETPPVTMETLAQMEEADAKCDRSEESTVQAGESGTSQDDPGRSGG